jgi:chemotaxis protein methyltransferase CheR
MVSFRTFNLLDHFGWLGEMDVIFCRNALIYFDAHTKETVIGKLAETLASDGYLALGAKESGVDMSAWAADHVRGIYLRSPGAAAQAERKIARAL